MRVLPAVLSTAVIGAVTSKAFSELSAGVNREYQKSGPPFVFTLNTPKYLLSKGHSSHA